MSWSNTSSIWHLRQKKIFPLIPGGMITALTTFYIGEFIIFPASLKCINYFKIV